MGPLTAMQRAYVAARISGHSGAAAARHAGYSQRTAKVQAARLETLPKIREAIEAGRAQQNGAAPPLLFESAADYLQAVVAGRVTPDPVRVSAARALLAFEKPRVRRPPPPTQTPTQAAASAAAAEQRAVDEDWQQKVAAIKSRLRVAQ